MGAVTDYLATLDEASAALLERLRARALALVPDADEGTSYGMAALRHRGRPLVAVLATKGGYSVYPFSSAVVADVVAGLPDADATKGGLRFTAARPLPDESYDALVVGRRDEIDRALDHSPRPRLTAPDASDDDRSDDHA